MSKDVFVGLDWATRAHAVCVIDAAGTVLDRFDIPHDREGLHSLPDGLLMMSFPRAGQLCAAQMLAELGDVRERFPNADRLAAEAGAVPVTYQSGKTRSVAFRWACNHRLRKAITCLADNSRHANDWAHGIYQAARARGCDHTHAIRILARAWLRVIWHAWTDRKPYDPALHRAAAQPAVAQGG
jgi:transposase